jgi:branched-chain amino acid transport system permease protein
MSKLRTISLDYYRLLAVIFFFLIVSLFLDQFQISLAILILFWALLGAAWNILGGYAGQFSFGHAAYYGIGAYTSVVLLLNYDLSPWVGMVAGAALAGLFALLIGYLSFRYGLKGAYFALATFAFAEMVRLIASELELINTSIGIHVPLIGGDSWLRLQFENTPTNFFYSILILFARHKVGYYFQAIREDEDAASALGVDPVGFKLAAIVISGALTALGGSFFVQHFGYVNPELVFGVAISIEILLRPIVGGIGTIWGPLVGAIVLTPMAEFTRNFVRNPPPFLEIIEGRAGVDVMIFGVILIAIIIFMPDGIVGAANRARERYLP